MILKSDALKFYIILQSIYNYKSLIVKIHGCIYLNLINDDSKLRRLGNQTLSIEIKNTANILEITDWTFCDISQFFSKMNENNNDQKNKTIIQQNNIFWPLIAPLIEIFTNQNTGSYTKNITDNTDNITLISIEIYGVILERVCQCQIIIFDLFRKYVFYLEFDNIDTFCEIYDNKLIPGFTFYFQGYLETHIQNNPKKYATFSKYKPDLPILKIQNSNYNYTFHIYGYLNGFVSQNNNKNKNKNEICHISFWNLGIENHSNMLLFYNKQHNKNKENKSDSNSEIKTEPNLYEKIYWNLQFENAMSHCIICKLL